MDLGRSEHDDWGPCEVEDVNSGQRYLMYPLPVAWPGAGCFLYECQSCQGRFEPAEWRGGCPTCTGRKTRRRKRR
jgi:hypothetical protein